MARWIPIDGSEYLLSAATETQMDLYLEEYRKTIQWTNRYGELRTGNPGEELAAYLSEHGGVRIYMHSSMPSHALMMTNWFVHRENRWECLADRQNCGLNDRHQCHLVLMPLDNEKKFDPTMAYNYRFMDRVELGTVRYGVPEWAGVLPDRDSGKAGKPQEWFYMQGLLFSVDPIVRLSPKEVFEAELLWEERSSYQEFLRTEEEKKKQKEGV